MSRVVVTGGRDYSDTDTIWRVLAELPADTVIVHGDARGADRHAAAIAREQGKATEAHPADWRRYGKRAGVLRNIEMIRLGADACIAFPGGTGTAHCKRAAEEAGIPVVEVAS